MIAPPSLTGLMLGIRKEKFEGILLVLPNEMVLHASLLESCVNIGRVKFVAVGRPAKAVYIEGLLRLSLTIAEIWLKYEGSSVRGEARVVEEPYLGKVLALYPLVMENVWVEVKLHTIAVEVGDRGLEIKATVKVIMMGMGVEGLI